jgi:AraC-like DNA-binding protein
MANTNSGELNDAPDPPLEGAPSFRFFPTAAPLCHFVEYLYASYVPQEFLSKIDAMRLPEVEAQLVFAIEEGNAFPGGVWLGDGRRACLFLQPGHLQMIPIPGSIRQAVGASLRPAGLRLLLPQGASMLLDAPLIALEDLWGAEARALLERLVLAGTPEQQLVLLESHLQARVQHVDAPSRAVSQAFQLMQAAHGEISTEQLARACGCSSRSLRSLTLAEAGLAPKHLARVVRIRHALELLTDAGVPLSAAAATSAFSDHAHMSREFRELIGAPPSQLGQRMRSPSIPSFSAERNLMSTGLLVMPKSGVF